MTIRGDSFSSVAGVLAFTRHLMSSDAGNATFNSTTRPTLTEVEGFIDEASGYLNSAIAAGGFDPALVRANSTAKLPCDSWVRARSSECVELTQRGVGFNEDEGNRYIGFRNMHKAAGQFVDEMKLGWLRLGVAQEHRASEGLAFTGQ